MYAIVRTGGRQQKVAVGDVVTVDRLSAGAGESVSLPVLMLVDDGAVTVGSAALAGASVTAEVVGNELGPKIDIMKFKNKTGYRRRQGHRARLTTLRVTGIEAPGG